MITISLEGKGDVTFPKCISGLELVQTLKIKDAVAILSNEKLQDLCDLIHAGAKISVLTYKDSKALEIIRHDAAHLLAQAIKNLYPKAKIAIGPVTENGFYYDVELDAPITEQDLPSIEEEMKKLANQNQEIKKISLSRKEALELFKLEPYKVEIISSIPKDELITCYQQGDFVDLCKGPHGPNTSLVRHFKLLKVSGSYWKGDSKNRALQRIYGTAWALEQDLKSHLQMLLEAEKRDHRKLGKTLDLFHFEEDMPGMVFWHSKGFAILNVLQKYIQTKQELAGYQQVQTPILCSNKLWQKSGHLEKFKQDMFVLNEDEKSLKPMSCPCHIQIFNHSLKSYKDLPIRMAEFGVCHRNEASGGLHGLMRVKSFIQDDGHIFCTKEQITQETVEFCALLKSVYKDLGFENISLKFADRPNVRAGSDQTWNDAEEALMQALKSTNIDYTVSKGEGAFYGPKLEFHLKDAIGRSWQCGTLQLDFVLPQRLDANYINHDGQKQHPVIIHRAILGTFERFIGILIEHHKGRFPTWIAPVQVAIATVVSECNDYALSIYKKLQAAKIRTILCTENDTISYKIRQLTLQKIPYVVIIGKKELEDQSISVRTINNTTQTILLEELIKDIDSASPNNI